MERQGNFLVLPMRGTSVAEVHNRLGITTRSALVVLFKKGSCKGYYFTAIIQENSWELFEWNIIA